MAREAAVKEMANSILRRLLARNESRCCADVKIGESALSFLAANGMGAPRRRGPAKLLDIDEARATVKSQSQRFQVARYCAREQIGR